jgi:hypothetical protein
MGNDSPMQQETDALPSAGAGASAPLPMMAIPPPLPTEDADAAIESRWSDLTTLYAEYDAAAGPGQTAPEPARPELTEVAAGAPGSPAPVALPQDAPGLDDLVRFRDGRDEPARRPRAMAGRRLSWLGLLAMAAGVAACVLTEWPVRRASPTLVGAVAGAAALLALVVSVVRGRTGSGIPVMALFLSLAAVAVDRYHESPKSPGTTGAWVKQQIDRVGPALKGNAPAVVTPAPAAAPAKPPGPIVAPAPPQPSTATPSNGSKLFTDPAAPDAPDGGFDVTFGSTDPPANAKPPAAAKGKPAAAAPEPTAIPVAPGQSDEYKAARLARQRAEEKLRNAEALFLERFERSPACQAAQAEVDAAAERVERLKKQFDPFAPELVQAARRRIEAQEKLSHLREDAMADDPKVTAARNDLDAAEARLRAALPPTAGKR